MIQPLRDDRMVQEQLPAGRTVHGAWQHMVAVIMLNQTGRKPVKTVLPIFLDRWPTPGRFEEATDEEVRDVIWPLGLVSVRLKRLRGMTRDFWSWQHDDASKLYGIGQYGSDSYEIFFRNRRDIEPRDKELKRYLQAGGLGLEPAHT